VLIFAWSPKSQISELKPPPNEAVPPKQAA